MRTSDSTRANLRFGGYIWQLKIIGSGGIRGSDYVFPDEGHGFARPQNNMAFNAATERFLAKYLGGRSEPPNDEEAKLLDSVKQ